MNEQSPNCARYAFYRAGLREKDGFINPNDAYKEIVELGLEKVCQKPGCLVILIPPHPKNKFDCDHFAFVESVNSTELSHRNNSGYDVSEISLSDLMRDYQGHIPAFYDPNSREG